MRRPRSLMYCGWDFAFRLWLRADRVPLLCAARPCDKAGVCTVTPSGLQPLPPELLLPGRWLLQKSRLWMIPGRCSCCQKSAVHGACSVACLVMYYTSFLVIATWNYDSLCSALPPSTANFLLEWKLISLKGFCEFCCLDIMKQWCCHSLTKSLSAALWFPGDKRLETTPRANTPGNTAPSRYDSFARPHASDLLPVSPLLQQEGSLFCWGQTPHAPPCSNSKPVCAHVLSANSGHCAQVLRQLL